MAGVSQKALKKNTPAHASSTACAMGEPAPAVASKVVMPKKRKYLGKNLRT